MEPITDQQVAAQMIDIAIQFEQERDALILENQRLRGLLTRWVAVSELRADECRYDAFMDQRRAIREDTKRALRKDTPMPPASEDAP